MMDTWYFEKVEFREFNRLFRDNVTEEFSDLELNFNSDYTLNELNTSSGTSRLGYWEVDVDYIYTGGENAQTTRVEEVIGTLTDTTSGIVELLNWDNLCVNNRKIVAQEQKNGGTYFYTLRKL